jgi:hypothetical protein
MASRRAAALRGDYVKKGWETCAETSRVDGNVDVPGGNDLRQSAKECKCMLGASNRKHSRGSGLEGVGSLTRR